MRRVPLLEEETNRVVRTPYSEVPVAGYTGNGTLTKQKIEKYFTAYFLSTQPDSCIFSITKHSNNSYSQSYPQAM
jgi:hypothetical protein